MADMGLYEIQDNLLALEQQDLQVKHHFTDGCYARELHIPKGVGLVGALHKTYHHFVVSKGRLLIKMIGQKMIVESGYHGITQPGDKRFIYAFEDSIFTTFHVTDLTDIEAIGQVILGVDL